MTFEFLALLAVATLVVTVHRHRTRLRAARARWEAYRQLDYWATTGFIVPTKSAKGSGSQRNYTVADVRRLEVAGLLSKWGVTIHRQRRMSPEQRERLLELLHREGMA